MKRLFALNIILLFFCVSDSDLITSNTFHYYDSVKVELVDHFISDSSDIHEFSCSIPNEKNLTSSKWVDNSHGSISIIVQNQNSIYQEIRIDLHSFFITSHQSNRLPQVLS